MLCGAARDESGGYCQKCYEKYEYGNRLTITATITDYDPPSPSGLRRDRGQFSPSSIVVVAVVVNRNGQENGGERLFGRNPLIGTMLGSQK